MSRAITWLRTRTPAAPERLAARAERALRDVDVPDDALAHALGEAALLCLADALAAGPGRAAALDLLAADALLTWGWEAAADGGAAGLDRFAAAFAPARLAALLPEEA